MVGDSRHRQWWPTVMILLSLVAQQGMELHQLDVKTAFFHEDLEEKIDLPSKSSRSRSVHCLNNGMRPKNGSA